jgi:hypothetical protein
MAGGRAALLVATYDYEDPGLKELRAPEADAKALAQVLMDAEIAGYEVTMLLNEPHYVVGEAIGDFYQNRRRQDVALLYFTGHGLKDDDGHLYFAMKNTKRNSLLFTGLAAEQIDAAMEASPSQQKILILDCCYSGAFPAGRTAKADSAVHSLEKLRGRGRVVLTASDATEYAFEGDSIRGQGHGSVFTKYLVEGMRTGRADLDGDGDISLTELYSYAHDKVIEEIPQQRPKKNEDVEGSIVIGRNINWTLPTYLTNAVGSPIARDRLAAIEGLAHLYRVGNPRVKTRVIEQMTLLGDDDSRSVSTAAQQWLRQEHADEAAAASEASTTPSSAETGPPSPAATTRPPAPNEDLFDRPAQQPVDRFEPKPADARGRTPAGGPDPGWPDEPPAAPPTPPGLEPGLHEQPAQRPGQRRNRAEPEPRGARGPAPADGPAASWPTGTPAPLAPPRVGHGSGGKPAQRAGADLGGTPAPLAPPRAGRSSRRKPVQRAGADLGGAPVHTPTASAPTGPPAASKPPSPAAKKPGTALAMVGLVLAIIGGVLPPLGIVPIGLIISILAYRQSHWENKTALAGIIAGVAGLLLSIVLVASGALTA